MTTNTKELFPTLDSVPHAPEKPERIRYDFYSMFMRERFGLPAEWRWYLVQSKGADRKFTLLEGDVPCGVYASGKRKGRTKWPKQSESPTFFSTTVLHADILKFIAEWEVKTGLCSECDGTGQRCTGWNIETGTKYAPCYKCGATGKFRTAAEAAKEGV